MRALAMTGMVTTALMPSIISGSLMRATPPSRRMSAGTRSRAITAAAPASSATLACSGVTTSMITPPFSISASPRLTRKVPFSDIRRQSTSDAVDRWVGFAAVRGHRGISKHGQMPDEPPEPQRALPASVYWRRRAVLGGGLALAGYSALRALGLTDGKP